MSQDEIPEKEQHQEDRSDRLIHHVRQWTVLVIGILLTVYAIVAKQPATLMVGVSMVGGVPVIQARTA